VVRLNQAVAEAMAYGPRRGLDRMADLEVELAEYPYLHAARADLLRRLGQDEQARAAYECALALTANASERRFLERRLAEIRARRDS
jgi:RNA polymerase sigma-70 factor (ECF subfamily)